MRNPLFTHLMLYDSDYDDRVIPALPIYSLESSNSAKCQANHVKFREGQDLNVSRAVTLQFVSQI